MQDNIDKVMQRGERLDDLRGKTGTYCVWVCVGVRVVAEDVFYVLILTTPSIDTKRGSAINGNSFPPWCQPSA